jgi:hypothetical protein
MTFFTTEAGPKARIHDRLNYSSIGSRSQIFLAAAYGVTVMVGEMRLNNRRDYPRSFVGGLFLAHSLQR